MCDGTFSHHCSKKSISTTCGIPQCGTYSKKSKSTTSFYVVLVPHGIGEMVLIALTQFFLHLLFENRIKIIIMATALVYRGESANSC